MILYTDINPYCCAVLGSRVADGSLPAGDVVMADVRDLDERLLRRYRAVHLFCGIGGLALGLAWAGWPVSLSVVTFGFPCQDISAAGKGEGLAGKRSGLFWEGHRVVEVFKPDRFIAENVGALESRGLDVVAAAMEQIGYHVEALRMGAWAVGAPHERERWWIVGFRRSQSDGYGAGARIAAASRGRDSRAVAAGAGEGGVSIADAGGTGLRTERIGEAGAESDKSGAERDAASERDRRLSVRSGRSEQAAGNAGGTGAREVQPDANGAERQRERNEQPGRAAAGRSDSNVLANAASGGCEAGAGGVGDEGGASGRGNDAEPAVFGEGRERGWQPPARGPWRRERDEWLYAGPPLLVYAGGAGLEKLDAAAESGGARYVAGRPDSTTQRGWPVPVLPGFVQHEWEFSRLYQRGVGDAVHGLSGRMAGSLNRSGVMALGNAVVPQVVKAIAGGVIEAGKGVNL